MSYRGIAFGAQMRGGGDLVVNTSQTGYQEVCTDPSYAGQVVVMTFPLIGNHGRFADDDQSERPWLDGLVVGHATAGVLGRARQIVHLLRSQGVPAIAGLDTRALARHLRETGSLRGVITSPGELDSDAAVAAARQVPAWEEQDFVAQVSAAAPYEVGDRGPVVAVIDLGLKTNIIRALHRRGARVRVLPHTASAAQVLAPDVEGVVISPGPGDPGRLDGPVGLAQAIIADGRPLLGICLGHQIVARAAGGQTRRLRFGHHAANHPVRDAGSGRVTMTAQNHEVEVVGDSLPAASGFFVSQQQPQRRFGGGTAPPRPAYRDRAVPPRGFARPTRRRRGLRSLPRSRAGPFGQAPRVSASRPGSILIIGSGPVIIGQAAEFDYAGTQACRALREEGIRTILLNSNPATIMTDPGIADVVYLEPLTVTSVERILEQERPDGILASLGGQTGLNLAVEVARAGLRAVRRAPAGDSPRGHRDGGGSRAFPRSARLDRSALCALGHRGRRR